MTRTLLLLALGSALVAGCGRGPASGDTRSPGPTPSPSPADAAPAEEPAAMTEADAAPIDWRIEPGRVGPIELGAGLPPELLARDPAAHYVARYIADAQPVDGFEFSNPPVLVLIEGGPFAARVDQAGEAIEPPIEELRRAAAEAARRGARVRWIMVTGTGPATAGGLGVGSTLDAIKAVHPDAHLSPRPPTLGHDLCIATAGALPGVGFVFASCNKARGGEGAVRVELWPVTAADD